MEARTVEKVINMGARDYLVKPFNQGDLQSKVARALKNTLEDQAELFLRRKIKVIQECCWNGNIGLAMLTMREIPKGVYSRSVLLRLSRGLTALHNRDVAHASEIVKEILNDIGK
jgi:DNA-binding response OmpR family regulator